MTVIVAFGANLPFQGRSPVLTCLQVIDLFFNLNKNDILCVSNLYESVAWPDSYQPHYINGALLLRCDKKGTRDLKSTSVLRALHRIEAFFGRERGAPNAARTLDLDLIAVEGEICQTDELILPHPRAHERAFVMVPVAEVAPDWVHPVLGRTAAQIAADLPKNGLTRLGSWETLAKEGGFRYQARSPEL